MRGQLQDLGLGEACIRVIGQNRYVFDQTGKAILGILDRARKQLAASDSISK